MNLVMNLTILVLSSHSFSSSPHFSMPLTAANQKNSFQRCNYQNFLSPLYTSIQKNKKLDLSVCTFQHFLDRVIQINNYHFINKTFFTFLETAKQGYDKTTVKNCKFCGIKSFHMAGGVILAFGQLIVKNSEFLKCSLQGYGVIASYSKVSVENTLFYKNKALFTSSIISDSEYNETFHVEGNRFIKCKSKICLGIIYRPSPSEDFKFAFNNYSLNIVKGDYGSIIINQSKSCFSHSIISNVRGSNYNCGIYIDINYFTRIESCIFSNLSRTSLDSNFGIALQIMASEKPSFISNCIFGKMEVSAPILFCSFNNILVEKSCFYQKREEIEFLPFFDFIDCTYDSFCNIENIIILSIQNQNETYIEENTLIISNKIIRNELEYGLYLLFPLLLMIFFLILVSYMKHPYIFRYFFVFY